MPPRDLGLARRALAGGLVVAVAVAVGATASARSTLDCTTVSVAVTGGVGTGGNDLHLNCLKAPYDTVQVKVAGHRLISAGITVTAAPAPTAACRASGSTLTCTLRPAMQPGIYDNATISWVYPKGDSGLRNSCALVVQVLVKRGSTALYAHRFGGSTLTGC